jgi:hypothetical protein
MARLPDCFSVEAAVAAHALAPSKEALDAPLSPPPLSDEPGPATGHSGVYPDRTHTGRPDPAFKAHHGVENTPRSPWADGRRALPPLSRFESELSLFRAVLTLSLPVDDERCWLFLGFIGWLWWPPER